MGIIVGCGGIRQEDVVSRLGGIFLFRIPSALVKALLR
jgi:hypothetical protein